MDGLWADSIPCSVECYVYQYKYRGYIIYWCSEEMFNVFRMLPGKAGGVLKPKKLHRKWWISQFLSQSCSLGFISQGKIQLNRPTESDVQTWILIYQLTMRNFKLWGLKLLSLCNIYFLRVGKTHSFIHTGRKGKTKGTMCMLYPYILFF